MILFIKNVQIEGPETMGLYFRNRGFEIKEIDLQNKDFLPENFDDIEAVVCLGGPMNVYEEEKYPFLKAETQFIRDIVQKEIPFLGVCLGSQLLAKACQGKVVESPNREVGFYNVQLTKDAQGDPLFKSIDLEIKVYQWHQDMSEIPQRAKLLAKAELCPVQAFRVGRCAYGFQFHIAITDKSIEQCSDEYSSDKKRCKEEKEMMLKEYKSIKSSFHSLAEKFYDYFLGIITNESCSRTN